MGSIIPRQYEIKLHFAHLGGIWLEMHLTTNGIATKETSEHALLLNTSEAANRLGISKRTLQELAAGRQIGFCKFGRNVRFSPSDLERFIEANRVKAIGWKGGAK